MFHTHPSSCISQLLNSINIFLLRTSDFAAWFAQQLLHACTRPLLAHLSTSPASSRLPVSASATLALLVETPLAIPATSGLNLFLLYNVYSHLPALSLRSVLPRRNCLPLPFSPSSRHAPHALRTGTAVTCTSRTGTCSCVERIFGPCSAGRGAG